MADSALTLFYSSVTGSLEIKKQQQKIIHVLDGQKLAYKMVDISQDLKDKELMRKIVGDCKALPPQICNGGTYCGDFEAFENAIEMEDLETFLKLKKE